MYERIIEIIVLVLSELIQNKKISEINIDELTSRGYTKEEITTAFGWLVERLEGNSEFINKIQSKTDKSFRILSNSENNIFTKEAWGEILNLHNLGLLSNYNIEAIIDWAGMIGIENMTEEQLKEYLAFNIFKFQNDNQYGENFIRIGNQSIN